MFKKLMASFGVGSAKVNLVLDKEQCRLGERLTGKVVIEGGNVSQSINTLDADITMKFNIRGKELSRVVDSVRVARDFTIEAREIREIPFEHQLSLQYPISKGSVSYHLQTKMDIAKAVDTGDLDKFFVLPSKEMQLVFESLQQLGFKEKMTSGKIGQYGQEFEFYTPTQFEDKIKELELKFFSDNSGLKLYMELEMSGGYMRSGIKHHSEIALPLDLIERGSVQEIANHLQNFLENELHQISVQGPRMAPSYHNDNYRHASHGSPFGGFMGGMVAGMLGGALLGELFGGDENAEEGGDMADSEEGEDGGGFDLGFGDFFGDDEF